jgi:hypothetical protein
VGIAACQVCAPKQVMLLVRLMRKCGGDFKILFWRPVYDPPMSLRNQGHLTCWIACYLHCFHSLLRCCISSKLNCHILHSSHYETISVSTN